MTNDYRGDQHAQKKKSLFPDFFRNLGAKCMANVGNLGKMGESCLVAKVSSCTPIAM